MVINCSTCKWHRYFCEHPYKIIGAIQMCGTNGEYSNYGYWEDGTIEKIENKSW